MWRYIGLARIVQIVRVSRHAFVGLFCGAFFDLILFNFLGRHASRHWNPDRSSEAQGYVRRGEMVVWATSSRLYLEKKNGEFGGIRAKMEMGNEERGK